MIYNEYIRPYFLLHVVSTIFANDLPKICILGIDVFSEATVQVVKCVMSCVNNVWCGCLGRSIVCGVGWLKPCMGFRHSSVV